jgi:glycerol-3-phosphate acyltransferase PlsY
MYFAVPVPDSGLPLWGGLAAAYLLGCFNTGYYLVRWRTGQDLRKLGSGSAGSKNTGRVLGPVGFGLTLLGDMLKGALALLGARLLGWSAASCILALVAVTAGHNWPVQLGFRGGKGLAASFGALLMFDPFLAGLMLGLCAVLLVLTRRVTLSATVPYVLCPALALFRGYDGVAAALLALAAALVVGPHLRKLRDEFAAQSVTPQA